MTEINIGPKYAIGDEIILRMPITFVTVVHSARGSETTYTVELPIETFQLDGDRVSISESLVRESAGITVRKKE